VRILLFIAPWLGAWILLLRSGGLARGAGFLPLTRRGISAYGGGFSGAGRQPCRSCRGGQFLLGRPKRNQKGAKGERIPL